jgi:WD40 repeat protein
MIVQANIAKASQELCSAMTDARRAISQCFKIIQEFPLEVYNSMLVWLPKEAKMRKKFEKLPKWKVTHGLLQSWSPCENTLNGHTGGVNGVAFSQDGRRVVSGSEDNTLRIWNVETGEEEKKLEGHSHYVTSVAFSQDGRRVVSGSEDKTVRIWNVETGEEEKKLEGHSDDVTSVAFSQDGRRVVSRSDDKTVRIWNMQMEKEGISDNQQQSHKPEHYLSFNPITVQPPWIYPSGLGCRCWFYHSNISAWASNSSSICFGLNDGHFFILKHVLI